MKGLLLVFALLNCLRAIGATQISSAETGRSNQVLIIAPSSTAVAGGKASLTVGPLQPSLEIYGGHYQVKVSPYFFKSEKGRLSIVIDADALAKVGRGLPVEITGTATTNGKKGQTRRIDATATPVDEKHGELKLWFLSGGRKLVFNTTYHFAGR